MPCTIWFNSLKAFFDVQLIKETNRLLDFILPMIPLGDSTYRLLWNTNAIEVLLYISLLNLGTRNLIVRVHSHMHASKS